MKRLTALLLVLLILLTFLCACGKKNDTIIGKWECTASESSLFNITDYNGDYTENIIGMQIVFGENGNIAIYDPSGFTLMTGRYELYGDNIVEWESSRAIVQYTYFLDGNTLQLYYVFRGGWAWNQDLEGLAVTFKRVT